MWTAKNKSQGGSNAAFFFMHLHQLTRQLATCSENPNLDAQVLLAHISEQPRSWILAHPENELTAAQATALKKALTQLQAGTPLPYVLGHREFFGLDFTVSADVLIPRPETEELVEHALNWLRNKNNARVMDMGTGSGCIPVSLARNAPSLTLLAIDRSSSALNIARQNAAKHGVADRIEFIESDLFANVPALERFNLITANLPYIPTETLKALAIYTREPTLALDGGADGLDLIRRFLAGAQHFLAPNGRIMLEIDSSHGEKARDAAKKFFPEANCKLMQDLSGRNRFIRIQT